MKIGLSFSRCVRDIVEGRVSMQDVLVVVARTDFDPRDDAQWSGIWAGYKGGSFMNMHMEWGDTKHSQEEFRAVSIDLWNSGKLHQPRKFGARPSRLPYYWLDVVLPSEELERNPAAKEAWQRFQVIAELTGTNATELK